MKLTFELIKPIKFEGKLIGQMLKEADVILADNLGQKSHNYEEFPVIKSCFVALTIKKVEAIELANLQESLQSAWSHFQIFHALAQQTTFQNTYQILETDTQIFSKVIDAVNDLERRFLNKEPLHEQSNEKILRITKNYSDWSPLVCLLENPNENSSLDKLISRNQDDLIKGVKSIFIGVKAEDITEIVQEIFHDRLLSQLQDLMGAKQTIIADAVQDVLPERLWAEFRKRLIKDLTIKDTSLDVSFDRLLRKHRENFIQDLKKNFPKVVKSAFYDSLVSELRKSLMKILNKEFPEVDDGIKEDAIQETIFTQAIRNYRYEASLLSWMFIIAKRLVFKKLKKLDSPPLGDDDSPKIPGSVPGPDEGLAYIEFLGEMGARYILVESFFKQEKKGLVRLIWIDHLENNGKGTDEIIRKWEKQTGEVIEINTIYTVRRRLLMRLRVLCYIHDLVPEGAPDKPGDYSILTNCGNGKVSETDRPTLRALAAYGRSTQTLGSICPALYARCWVDKKIDLADFRYSTIPLALAADCNNDKSACDTLLNKSPVLRDHILNAEQWIKVHGKSLPPIKTFIKTFATSEKISFLLGPCWLLSILLARSDADIITILNLKPDEIQPTRVLVQRIASFPVNPINANKKTPDTK